jgi:ribokinase
MVVGQAARDPVVVVDALPGPSGAAHMHDQRELSGGKGANQAVGLAQLGVRVGPAAAVVDTPRVGAADNARPSRLPDIR